MKHIYFLEEGRKEMYHLLGTKGANLCEMYNLGLPVPYAFILINDITELSEEIKFEIKDSILKFNGKLGEDLFFSVRSSPITSMPGMLDSVLNVNSIEDLFEAINVVLKSWDNKRAQVYKENNNISNETKTAVIIQQMVFGNKDKNSGSGVVFSSNPNNSNEDLVGEILFESQGDDLVLGKVTPYQISKLKEEMSNVFIDLEKISKELEHHFKCIQEIEFTIENKNLYILQTRNVNKKEKKKSYEIEKKDSNPIFRGIPSSFGAASGVIVFNSEKAVELKEKGQKVILLRPETSPEDIEGIISCDGIITLTGGITSHAAVVARSMGKPCICGCEGITIKELDWVTIDGRTGEIFLGEKKLILR